MYVQAKGRSFTSSGELCSLSNSDRCSETGGRNLVRKTEPTCW